MITVASLASQKHFRDAVRLQKEIWQFEDVDLLPARLFVVASKIGGQIFGAFDGKDLVAFALAIPGIKPNYGGYLHSHMVGVSADYRNRGVGRLLKLRQREDALARGIDLMEWTFDPLETKNAYFNIERLGAVIRRYVLNQYGISTSALHTGLPTDRCIAEWWLRTDRVAAAVAGDTVERPRTVRRISVPNGMVSIRQQDHGEAKRIQARVSQQFTEAFDAGLAVVGFEQTETTGDYLLGEGQW